MADYQNSYSDEEAQIPFQNIPRKKLEAELEEVKSFCCQSGEKTITEDNRILSLDGAKLLNALQRYYEANIPVDYWFKDMHDFKGDKTLIRRYNELTKSIKDTYKNGTSICFAGSHGLGKTMTCTCILKRAVETGKYNALYVNLTDIIHAMTSASTIHMRDAARKRLLEVDFLVIDEFDQRFMGTDNAADLFGRILEPIMRTRIQNKLPLFFCSNSSKVEDSFTGPLKASITSLMHKFIVHSVMPGKDFRLEKK